MHIHRNDECVEGVKDTENKEQEPKTMTTTNKNEAVTDKETHESKKPSGKKKPSKAENTTGDNDDDGDTSEPADFSSPISVPQEHPNLVTVGLKVYTKKEVPVFDLMARLPVRVKQNAKKTEVHSADEDENESDGEEKAEKPGSEVEEGKKGCEWWVYIRNQESSGLLRLFALNSIERRGW